MNKLQKANKPKPKAWSNSVVNEKQREYQAHIDKKIEMDRKIKDHVSQLKQGSTRDSLNSKDDPIIQEMECVSLQSSSP